MSPGLPNAGHSPEGTREAKGAQTQRSGERSAGQFVERSLRGARGAARAARRRLGSKADSAAGKPRVRGGVKGQGWARPAGRRQGSGRARGLAGGAPGRLGEGAGGGPGVEEVSGAGGWGGGQPGGGRREAGEASCPGGLSPVSSPRVWAAALLLW